jgi:hypothetical protein
VLTYVQALIHSDAARQGALEDHRSIKLSTYGVVFMGTPHQGGNGVQLGRLLVNVASLFVAADDRLLKHLERESEWLQQQLAQYGPISSDFVTKFAYEEYETPTAFGRSILVRGLSTLLDKWLLTRNRLYPAPPPWCLARRTPSRLPYMRTTKTWSDTRRGGTAGTILYRNTSRSWQPLPLKRLSDAGRRRSGRMRVGDPETGHP